MRNEIPNQTLPPARVSAEPLTSMALFQSFLILGALGIAAYKVLDLALQLL